MQIDFHHATTYVLARLAGFDHPEANIIAHSAQYVDDATNEGVIYFDNGAMYRRICSAHEMLDHKNFDELANHQVWIPYHFLPGNGGMPARETPPGGFIEKIICRPDSPVARDMVRTCINNRDRPYGLHRLGITMHVYADTWAHQGFAGVKHQVNSIRKLDDEDNPGSKLTSRIKTYFGDKFDEATSAFVGDALPLGHGAALSFPDRPYLKWSYTDHNNHRVIRDNTAEFVKASDALCKAMQCYRAGNPDADVSGLSDENRSKLETLFRTIVNDNGEERHKDWLQHISDGYFGFPGEQLSYIPKDVGSWKHDAIGDKNEKEVENIKFEYKHDFLHSNWKMFHDALQAHHFDIVHDILPEYDICAA